MKMNLWNSAALLYLIGYFWVTPVSCAPDPSQPSVPWNTTTTNTTTTNPNTTSTTIAPPSIEAPPDNAFGDNGNYCLLVSVSLNLTLQYIKQDSGETAESLTFQVPTKNGSDATVTGVCAGATMVVDGVAYTGPVLVSQWAWPSGPARVEEKKNTVAISFESVVAGSALNKVKASIDLNNDEYFPGADTAKRGELEVNPNLLLSAGSSFSCGKALAYKNGSGSVVLNDINFEIGHNLDADKFGDEKETCGADSVSTTLLLLLTCFIVFRLF